MVEPGGGGGDRKNVEGFVHEGKSFLLGGKGTKKVAFGGGRKKYSGKKKGNSERKKREKTED